MVVAEVIALELRRPAMGNRAYIYPQAFTVISYLLASLLLFELWRVRRAQNADEQDEPQPHAPS
jgi:hypothetical protein